MPACEWKDSSALMRAYHDTEWGVPVHDDHQMFEHLMLEVLQCGLSWELVLKRREKIRAAFGGPDFERIARFSDEDIIRVLTSDGMIRSERKVRAIVRNAQACCAMHDEVGSFCDWFWDFTGGKTVLYEGHETGEIPASNGLSARIAAELKRRGFTFVGPTTIYAHLQACGIVCDHVIDCPCYERIVSANPTIRLPRDNERP
jgi:DNA-3-methyladenine glycosylase I